MSKWALLSQDEMKNRSYQQVVGSDLKLGSLPEALLGVYLLEAAGVKVVFHLPVLIAAGVCAGTACAVSVVERSVMAKRDDAVELLRELVALPVYENTPL